MPANQEQLAVSPMVQTQDSLPAAMNDPFPDISGMDRDGLQSLILTRGSKAQGIFLDILENSSVCNSGDDAGCESLLREQYERIRIAHLSRPSQPPEHGSWVTGATLLYEQRPHPVAVAAGQFDADAWRRERVAASSDEQSLTGEDPVEDPFPKRRLKVPAWAIGGVAAAGLMAIGFIGSQSGRHAETDISLIPTAIVTPDTAMTQNGTTTWLSEVIAETKTGQDNPDTNAPIEPESIATDGVLALSGIRQTGILNSTVAQETRSIQEKEKSVSGNLVFAGSNPRTTYRPEEFEDSDTPTWETPGSPEDSTTHITDALTHPVRPAALRLFPAHSQNPSEIFVQYDEPSDDLIRYCQDIVDADAEFYLDHPEALISLRKNCEKNAL